MKSWFLVAALVSVSTGIPPRPEYDTHSEVQVHGGDFVVYKTVRGFPVVEFENGTMAFAKGLDKNGFLTPFPGAFVDCVSDPNLELGADRNLKPKAPRMRETTEQDRSVLARAKRRPHPMLRTAGKGIGQRPARLNNLVILLRFADHKLRPLRSREDFEIFFNQRGKDPDIAPTGSVRDYFLHQSYNAADVVSVVTDWIDVDITESQASEGCSGLCGAVWGGKLHEAIHQALAALETSGEINLRQFDLTGDGFIDGFTIIHSGYGAEWTSSDADGKPSSFRIWSHQWTLSKPFSSLRFGVQFSRYNVNTGFWQSSGREMTRIGAICHEMSHGLFGLPDLYDGKGEPSASINVYDIMSNAWGLDGSQLYPGSFSPWSKLQVGWIKPVELKVSGIYEIRPFQESESSVYIIRDGFPTNEYLLIEYRSQAFVYDSKLPGGILVWHIDESMRHNLNHLQGFPGDNANWPETHYMVRLIQADNLWHLEKEPYYSFDPGDAYRNWFQVLSDTSQPSLLSYAERIRKSKGLGCTRTGHKLYNFGPSQRDPMIWEFEYERVSRNECNEPEVPIGKGGGGLRGVPTSLETPKCMRLDDASKLLRDRDACLAQCKARKDCMALIWRAANEKCQLWAIEPPRVVVERAHACVKS